MHFLSILELSRHPRICSGDLSCAYCAMQQNLTALPLVSEVSDRLCDSKISDILLLSAEGACRDGGPKVVFYLVCWLLFQNVALSIMKRFSSCTGIPSQYDSIA